MSDQKKAWEKYLEDLELHRKQLLNDIQYHTTDAKLSKQRVKSAKAQLQVCENRIKEATAECNKTK